MAAEQTPRAKPSARDRYRYIAFQVQGKPGPSRKDLIQLLGQEAQRLGAIQTQPWLTRYNGEHGILRVLRAQLAEGRRLLEAFDADGIRLVAMSTSGTIAALLRKALRRQDLHRG